MSGAVENTPKLRFPEFSGEWKYKKIRDIGHVIRGASPRPKADPRFYGPGVPRLMVQDVARDGKYVTPKTDSLTPKGAKQSRLCPEGTLTIVCSGTAKTVGQPSFLTEDACIHDGFMAIVDIDPEQSDDFIYYQIQRFQQQSERLATHGGTFINLTTEILREFQRLFPKKLEQQKIATFLGAMDKKIAQLAEKNSLLEDYKEGCMQQLFSQKIRFKDEQGYNFPCWEEKTIGDIFSWIGTNSFSRERLTYDAGQIQNIHYGDIHTKFSPNFHQAEEHVPYIKETPISDFKQEQFCRVGDVVIADASEDYADIGKAIEIVSLGESPLVAGLHTYIARPKEASIQLGFAGYLLRSQPMRRQIQRIAQGISVLGISKGNLEKLTLLLPHPDEQRKIADFLSGLDHKIDLSSQELENAREFKRGLLQKMFA